MTEPALERIVVADADDVATEAMRLVLEAEREAISRSGMFRICLAGGSTPRRLYQRLAQSTDAQFKCWSVFFGDERWVPHTHPDSNYRMAREALLDHVPVPPHQVHPIDTRAGAPEDAAELYSLVLRRKLGPPPGEMPRFDLVLLGLGTDAHTASLFPGSSALVAKPTDAVVATWAPTLGVWRITLTVRAINAARAVVFLVSGADKATALGRVLTRDHTAPATLIEPHDGTLTIVADADAAAETTGPTS